MVASAGVELFRVLITRNLLIIGTVTTAKKGPIARSIVRLLYENAFRCGVPRTREFEYVGTKPLGTGCNPANLNSQCTGTPVKGFRGAVVRPFLNSRMDAKVNFLIASGYSGQTRENFYPSEIQQVVGVRMASYASVTVTYRFGRQPTP